MAALALQMEQLGEALALTICKRLYTYINIYNASWQRVIIHNDFVRVDHFSSDNGVRGVASAKSEVVYGEHVLRSPHEL